MPTFVERLSAAIKALRFPLNGSANTPYTIFPTMQDWQHAITNALPGSATAPTSDPAQSSLVMSAVRWVSTTLPEAPVEVMEPGEEGPEIIENHKLPELIRKPNPYTDEPTLWKAFAYSWVISGNAYWIKFRNQFNQVVELWNEPYTSIRPRWVNDKKGTYIPAEKSTSNPGIGRNDSPNLFINYYEVDRDGGQYRIEPEDVVHFKDGEDPNNRRLGLSFIGTILREIFGDSAAADYAGGLLAANGIPPFVLSIDDKIGQLTQEDINGIKDRLVQQIRSNGGREPLVTQFARVEKMGMTADEIDLTASRFMGEARFAAVIGIPVECLNLGLGNEHSTYNNVTEAEKAGTRRYLVPLWWAIDQAITRQLLPEFDQDESHYVEHDTTEVAALQPDENAESLRVVGEYQGGVITRAEARTQRGRDVDPQGRDDVYFVKPGTETVTLEQEQELRDNPPEAQPSGQFPAPVQPKMLAKGIHHLSSREQQEKIREHWERHAPARVKGLITAKGR